MYRRGIAALGSSPRHTSSQPRISMLRGALIVISALWLAYLLLRGPVQMASSSAIASISGWKDQLVLSGGEQGPPRRAAAADTGHLSYDYFRPVSDDNRHGTQFTPRRVSGDNAAADDVVPVLEALQAMAPLPTGVVCLAPLDKAWPSLLDKAELHVYSQNMEDGVLLGILLNVGVTARTYVEFGTEDGSQCNTRLLRERLGWRGLLMDSSHSRPSINLRKETITPENINVLLTKHLVLNTTSASVAGNANGAVWDPLTSLDVMSIDLDYSDWWVWRAIDGSTFQPRVIIVEYNSAIPINVSVTVDDEDGQRWTGSNYFGASLKALAELGVHKGYTLVYADSQGVNAFFVRSDILACQGVAAPALETVWRPPSYGGGFGHPQERNSSRRWLFLDAAGSVVKREFVANW